MLQLAKRFLKIKLLKSMKNFAPILIPTLNRHVHFKRCVESLAICTYADQTDLYIALDYPLKESHWEGYKKISIYLDEINGFKSVNVIRRDKNLGARENIVDARNEIFKQYDRIIVSEDDNEFSPNFLDYINVCLEKYENNENVLAITGYNRMIDMNGYDKNIYSALSFCAWGFTISRKDYQFLQKEITNTAYAKKIIQSWSNSYKIYKRSPSLLRGLLSVAKTGTVTNDTMIVTYMILNNKYCIWPTVSKVRNHGFDGGGEHFGSIPDHPMLKQEIDTASFFEPDDIEIKENEVIKARTKQYAKQSLSLFKRLLFGVYIPLQYLIYRFTGIIIYK